MTEELKKVPEPIVVTMDKKDSKGMIRCLYCGISREAVDHKVALETSSERTLKTRQDKNWMDHVSNCLRHSRKRKRITIEYFDVEPPSPRFTVPDPKRLKAVTWVRRKLELSLIGLQDKRAALMIQIAGSENDVKTIIALRDAARLASNLHDATPGAPYRNSYRVDQLDHMASTGASLLRTAREHLAMVEGLIKETKENSIEIAKIN